MFTVYILFSHTTQKYYTGQTQNLENRLLEHNSGETPSILRLSIKFVSMRYLPFFILLLITTINISCTKTPNIEVENNNVLMVFPNPCFGVCTAGLNNSSGQNYTITIYDTDGKEMKKVENLTSSANISFDLSNEAEGKYIAIASNGTDKYSVSFLKVKR